MNKLFYPQLALSNLKKNSSVYLPYLLTCICSICMFYIMHFISVNEGLSEMSGGATVGAILKMGDVVIGFFSVLFLFYTNSFVMKRRKKELGLYNILGMEKKHIAKMLFLETLYVAGAGLVLGIGAGVLLSRLMFLLLLKLLQFSVPLGYSVPLQSIGATVALFAVLFLGVLVFNLAQIHLAAPVEMLRGNQHGEKEPRAKWILALLGAIALAGGYGIAVICASPLDAVLLFFPAVILVMIGTYLLFTAGSVAALKLMKANRRFYYKPRHFTVVSGLLYRMKQNAAGLANICILSTMVLVILSTTLSMYIGMEESMIGRFPTDAAVLLHSDTPDNRQALERLIEENAKKYGTAVTDRWECEFIAFVAAQNGDVFTADSVAQGNEKIRAFYLMTLDQYNRIEGKSAVLAEDEALIYDVSGRGYGRGTMTIAGKQYSVTEANRFVLADSNNTKLVSDAYYMVVRDRAEAERICSGLNVPPETQWKVSFNLTGGEEAKEAFADKVLSEAQGGVEMMSRQRAKSAFLTLNGGFLFLGLFLGGLFLMATVLIIYYKQISEGYEDKDRFAIMKKVGMGSREVKESIHSQILMVFFLPLAAAILHIVFAFRMFSKLLNIFMLDDVGLFLRCTVGTILVFGVFYVIVYGLTARTYYKIVNYERG